MCEGYTTYYGGGGFATYFEDYENRKIRLEGAPFNETFPDEVGADAYGHV